MTRAQLLDHVWGYDFGGDARVLETYISYLRKQARRARPAARFTPFAASATCCGSAGNRARDEAARCAARCCSRVVALIAARATVGRRRDLRGAAHRSCSPRRPAGAGGGGAAVVRARRAQAPGRRRRPAPTPSAPARRPAPGPWSAAVLPPGTFGALLGPSGNVVEARTFSYGGRAGAAPGAPRPSPDLQRSGRCTVHGQLAGAGRPELPCRRVRARSAAGRCVVAVPLHEVDQTLHRLVEGRGDGRRRRDPGAGRARLAGDPDRAAAAGADRRDRDRDRRAATCRGG